MCFPVQLCCQFFSSIEKHFPSHTQSLNSIWIIALVTCFAQSGDGLTAGRCMHLSQSRIPLLPKRRTYLDNHTSPILSHAAKVRTARQQDSRLVTSVRPALQDRTVPLRAVPSRTGRATLGTTAHRGRRLVYRNGRDIWRNVDVSKFLTL